MKALRALFCLLVPFIFALPSLAQSPWYAWVYSDSTGQLTLLDASGPISSFTVPAPRIETIHPSRQFAISRDGARIAMVSATGDDRPLILFQEFRTNGQALWTGDDLEWMLPSLESQFAISTLTFSPDSTLFAIGMGNPDAGLWRVVILDVFSGQAVFQLNSSDAAVRAFVAGLGTPPSYVIPVVRLFDYTTVHIQLVSANVEGVESYPTLAWSPGDGQIAQSDYNRPFMDISPSNREAIFPYQNVDLPTAQSFSYTSPNNAIAKGLRGTQNLWAEAGALVLQARWAGGQSGAVVQLQDPDTFQTRWQTLPLDGATRPAALAQNIVDVRGTPDGFLTLTSEGRVNFHPINDPAAAVTLATLQAASGEIIWVGPAGVPYLGPLR